MRLNCLQLIDLNQSFWENNVTTYIDSITRSGEHAQQVWFNLWRVIHNIMCTDGKNYNINYHIWQYEHAPDCVLYDSHYNLSVFSNLCGHELQSDPMHIFYGEHYITKLWAYI